MEVKHNPKIGENGLFASRVFEKDEIVHILRGQELNFPTRESVHVGDNVHIVDPDASFMNHSFEPSVTIDGRRVVALRRIQIGEEITFNYNSTELFMACPFVCEGMLVSGSGTENKWTNFEHMENNVSR